LRRGGFCRGVICPCCDVFSSLVGEGTPYAIRKLALKLLCSDPCDTILGKLDRSLFDSMVVFPQVVLHMGLTIRSA